MAYNRVNGIHCAENAELIDIVKNEWAFDGVLVSDWFGVVDTIASATAGLDLEMPGPARFFGEQLVDAVARGDVTAERLTDMTRDCCGWPNGPAARSGVAHAAKGTVPVDRDSGPGTGRGRIVHPAGEPGQALPLDPTTLSRIAVIGVNATSPCLQGGTFARVNPIGPVDLPTRRPAGRARGRRCRSTTPRVSWRRRRSPCPNSAGQLRTARPGSLLETFAPGDEVRRVRRGPAVVLLSSGSGRFPGSVPPRTRGSGSPRC